MTTPGIFDNLGGERFGLIMADNPWKFKSHAAPKPGSKSRRDVERHYETMTLDAIKALPVRDIAAKNCHLMFWTTSPFLPDAFDVIRDWGFRYSSTAFVWLKQKRRFNPDQLQFIPGSEADMAVGLGFTTRKNVEFCILARRGSPKRLARDVREVIISPVREHSRKPDEAYARAERYAAGPYLELFGRQSRPGWTVWGDEASKFDTVQTPG